MKELSAIILFTILFSQSSFAAPPTPTSASSPTPTEKSTSTNSKTTPSPKQTVTEADIERIQKIKEMVAKKVAELKLVEKKGFLGKVTEVKNTQITIEVKPKDSRIIDIDELTKFQETAGGTKTFGISDIKAGDTLTFVGLYNKATKRLLARVVTKTNAIPVFLEGIVVLKTPKDFSFVTVDEKGKKQTVEIETSTKTQTYSKENGAAKSGYTKITIGQRVVIAGFTSQDDSNVLIASRVIHFQDDTPPSEKMKQQAETVEIEEPSVTSKSTPTSTKKTTR